MKNIKNLILIIAIFIITVICILFVFTNNIKNIRFKNKVIDLVNYLYTLPSDEYYYKNGALYDSNNTIISIDYYINAEGNLIKDKYNNIKLTLKNKDRCAYKTPLGKVKVNTKCTDINIEKPEIVHNNSQVSFKYNEKIHSYLISKEDNLKGNWIKVNNTALILNLFEEGKYYIWFKNSKGALSETIEFEIKCLLAEHIKYNKDILYCTNSIIMIEDEEWIVIEDKNKELTIMKLDSLDTKLSHTENNNNYKWSASLINKYLNNTYINTLNDNLKINLKEVEICNSPSGTSGCDSKDGCGGYKKETIEKYNWKCDSYTKSKIRIISYDEYAKLYDTILDKTLLEDNYWMINSYKETSKAASIMYNGEIQIDTQTNTKLNIKPVITLLR